MGKKLHIRTSLIAFLKLIRLNNLFILSFTQYMTAIFLVGPKENWTDIITDIHLLMVALSTVTIAAAGYIINDYYDIKIDIINKPKRVVVGKLLTRRIAIFSHTVLNFLGIVFGLLASWKIGVIAFSAAFFLWLYSNSLKRLPVVGNIMVSFLTSLSIVLIGIYYKRNMDLILIYAVFAFFISLIREVIKDMEDLKGDAAFGCKTLPLVVGIRKTKFFIYAVLTVFILTLFLLGQKLNQLILLYFLFLIVLAIIYLVFRLIRSDSSKDFRFLSTWCKFIMITGVMSMLFI